MQVSIEFVQENDGSNELLPEECRQMRPRRGGQGQINWRHDLYACHLQDLHVLNQIICPTSLSVLFASGAPRFEKEYHREHFR